MASKTNLFPKYMLEMGAKWKSIAKTWAKDNDQVIMQCEVAPSMGDLEFYIEVGSKKYPRCRLSYHWSLSHFDKRLKEEDHKYRISLQLKRLKADVLKAESNWGYEPIMLPRLNKNKGGKNHAKSAVL